MSGNPTMGGGRNTDPIRAILDARQAARVAAMSSAAAAGADASSG